MFGLTIGTIAFVITLPFQLIYTGYCLKRIFNLSIKGILLKTLFFILIAAVFFVILSIFSAIIMYLNGDLDDMIKAKN